MYRSPLMYRGSKKASLQHLIFPEGLFVDVFGGSGIVTLNREGPRVYNDIDKDLVNFMKAIQLDPFKLIKEVEFILYAREEWERAKMNKHIPVCFFIYMTCSMGGTGDSWGRVLKDQIRIRTQEKAASFIPASERLQGVTIENLPWQDIFKKYDSKNTIFYCDPPYEGTNTNYGNVDHRQLLDAIFQLQGFCAISSYANPLYEKYPWDEIKSWVLNGNMNNNKVKEYLWLKK